MVFSEEICPAGPRGVIAREFKQCWMETQEKLSGSDSSEQIKIIRHKISFD
jgi:hypothetical protein